MQSFDTEASKYRKPQRTGELITVGRIDDLPPGRSATVSLLDGRELAVFNIEGMFYAIENFCSHKGAPLVEGALCGHTVQCEWHGWQFDVRTGQCLTTNSGDIDSYEVLINDGKIKVVV